MKKYCFEILVVGLGMMLLAGCGQHQEQQPAPAPAQSVLPEPEKPAVSKDQIGYYNQHLDEAKKIWHECKANGLSTLTDEERANCTAAQNAWMFQVYKPGSPKND